MVQPQIPLDKIGKVIGISRFSTVSHGEVRSERFDLVLI